ncbi:MAG: hypothetical protein OWQ57_07100 [Sulfobacillus sp.]|nr:hypothetical protein [Sulfobacillus sp.]
MVDKKLVQGIGTVALFGSALFFGVLHVTAVGVYLLLAGVVFWLFTIGWTARYQRVLDAPPDGYRPTGEIYPNPGGDGPVAVYFRGIRRVYVKYRT